MAKAGPSVRHLVGDQFLAVEVYIIILLMCEIYAQIPRYFPEPAS